MSLTAKKVYAILKRQISDMEAKLNSPIRYRGTVATADLLPLNPDIGDMYNIESKSIYGEAGMNVAWNGVVWDTMGAPIDMSLYFTKEEAEAVIQRLVTEYLEKNPVKPGATTEQAQQIEQNKTDIVSLKTDISTKITKFYKSNQGGTHITDSDNGKIQDMVLYGKSEQNQYKGINLLPTGISYGEIIEVSIPKGTRIFWVTDGTPAIGGNFKFYNEDKTQEMWFGVDAGKTTMTRTTDIDAKYMEFLINETSLVKICLGIGDDPVYEPYTGGQPSPSPDYPQEIKSVVNPTVKVSNEDGTKSQTVTLLDTLNAIPVSSGGNVTIDGQQYVADYVDVERGKIVRNVENVTFNGAENENWELWNADKEKIWSFMFVNSLKTFTNESVSKCNRFEFNVNESIDRTFWLCNPSGMPSLQIKNRIIGKDITAFKSWLSNNPINVIYPLRIPIEEELTAEHAQALKELATYYPVTNISIGSEQLDGYTVFNYPTPFEDEWNKTQKEIGGLKAETGSLKEDLSDLSKSVNGIELSKNLLDNSSVMENKRPSNWAGQTINDSYKTDGYHTFKAIPVTQNNTYYFVENGDLVNFGQLATYDKDGKYVSLLSPSVFNVNGVKVGYIIPENIAYVRGESKTSDFSKVNFKLFNGRFEKKFLKYNESAYGKKILPVVVFDFDQVVEIDARFTILKKYGFVGNVVEVATNNYEITKELIRMGYDISPYLGNHTWDYSTDEGIQNLTANIAEKLGGLETVGVYNPTMISCSGHKYSDTMEKILSSYKIDYVRCSGFIKNGVSLKKSMYENSYDTRIVVPISLGSYNGADEFNATIDSLVDGNVPLIMPFMHTFGYDADWITQEAFEKVVSHVSDLVKNGKALCMNMHDFVAYNDTVKSIHDDYIRNMSAIFN